MKNLLVMLVTMVICAGCFNQYQAQRERIYAENNTAFDALNKKCASLTYGESSLIFDEVGSEASKRRFVQTVCYGEVDENCLRRFTEMHFARMRERYVGADWNACKLYMDGHPEVYGDSRALELVVLRNHNRAVQNYCEAKRAEIRSNTSQRIANVNAEQSQAFSEAFASIGAKSTTKCYGSGNSVRCYSR